MFTHKKRKLFQGITVIALAVSLVQVCWAGFDSTNQAVDADVNSNEHMALNADGSAYSDLNLKRTINDDDDAALRNINSKDAKLGGSMVKLNDNVMITNSPRRVTLSLRDSDIRQVLRMFADKANLNVVFHNSVEGKVTLDLNNVTLNDAFLLVLRSSELTYIKDGKNIIVSTIEASKTLGYNKQNFAVIPIRYVDSAAVAKFLNANVFSQNISGLSTTEIVSSNPRQNEIMVMGTDNDIAIARRVTAQLDTKPMVNEFKVNHTTPKEMAFLICQALVPSNDSLTSSGGVQSATTENQATQTAENQEKQDITEEQVRAVKIGGGDLACRSASSRTIDSASTSTSGGAGGASMSDFPAPALSVVYFSDLGKVGIYGGSYEQVKVIRDFIAQNDKKQPMAYIEMSVIELNETGSKDFSNEWNLWTPFLSIGFDGTNGLATDTNHPVIIGPDTNNLVKYSGSSVLSYKLKYLVENGKGRVLTNPKIMVTNGQRSVIDLTSDYLKSIQSEVSSDTYSQTPIVTKTYEIGNDEGLKIELVPFISPDGYVSLNIIPEFATIKDQIHDYNVSTKQTDVVGTLLQRRNLRLNNLRIKDGETLVIAGLIKENEKQSVNKVPLLGDLPLVGVFFRNSSVEKSKDELVIMITPHIVYSEEQVKEIKSVDL